MNTRTKWTLSAAAAAITACAGVYAAAGQLGFTLDRPAWRTELMVVADAVQQLQQEADARELRRLRAREDDLVLQQQQRQASGGRPDPVLELQLRQVRRQIDDLQRALQPPQ